MVDKIGVEEWKKCKNVILEDVKLKEIDAIFYDLLDGVNDEIAVKMEEAYLEYGTRAIQLAYLQGLIDAKVQKTE